MKFAVLKAYQDLTKAALGGVNVFTCNTSRVIMKQLALRTALAEHMMIEQLAAVLVELFL